MKSWKDRLFFRVLLVLAVWTGAFLGIEILLSCLRLRPRQWIEVVGAIGVAILLLAVQMLVIVGLIRCAGSRVNSWFLRAAAGAGVLLLTAGVAVSLYVGVLAFAFGYHPEHIVERDGKRYVAVVSAFLEVHVDYYDYRNIFIRGSEVRISEWYGNGGYDPFTQEEMPAPKDVRDFRDERGTSG